MTNNIAELAAKHNDIANSYKAQGNIDKAMQHIREAIRIKPNYSAAFNNLGCIFYSQGNLEAAMQNFQKALRITPNFLDAHFNLANCYARKNQMESASHHYIEVLKSEPNHLIANFNLGMFYVSCQEHELIIQQFTKVIELDPNSTQANYQLGIAYLDTGNTIDAEKYLKKTITLDPTISEAYHNLAVLNLKQEKRDTALQYFQKTLELDPNNKTAIHMINSLTHNNNTLQAPTEYVKNLFDQYADYYESHVKEKLEYNVPFLLRQSIGKVLGNNTKLLNILDLGCGTGLCSIYFCDLANKLVGVDLAENMLAYAKHDKTYDLLCMYDINQAIPAFNKNYFDLVIAADVLVYCGDLDQIFKNCNQAINENGLFGFTIENTEENNNYELLPSGRFAHNIEYIKQLAVKYKFTIELQQDIVPRKNNGEPIHGKLFVLKREKDLQSNLNN